VRVARRTRVLSLLPHIPMPLPRLRTAVRWIVLMLFLTAAAASVWLLVYGGRYLQHEDPLVKADAIFVLAGTRLERPLEAVDLYKEGWAPLIVLSPGRPEPSEYLVQQRGINFRLESELQRDALIQLGVPAAAIPLTIGYIDNTAQEANLLRAMVKKNKWRRVIIVTSKYHTRRAAFAFRRGLEGTGADVIMRATKYDPSDPARWWRFRSDFRFATSEFQKLIAYRLGLGG
jgi:uncharacterized SAM-binding protein YcdF (DUF218 family)